MPTVTVQQALEVAIQHHQAGRLAEAEAIYRQILAQEPHHAGALHLLGVIGHQVGRDEIAVDLIRRAIAINPSVADYHCNLGQVLTAQGEFAEVVVACRRALEIKPDYPEAQANLGVALSKLGHLDEAITAYRSAIQLRPDYVYAHNNLANALRDKGHFDEAIVAYRRALHFKPDSAEVYYNLGNALKDNDQVEEAVAAYRKATEIKPDFAPAHNNLGGVLRNAGRFDEAITAYRKAIQLMPDYAAAYGNLGNTLKESGRVGESIAAYRRVVELASDDAEAHNNLGNALRENGHVDEAIAVHRRALQLEPDYAEACNHLGNALRDKSQIDEAITAYRGSLELKPDYMEAHNNLGNALKDQSKLDEAVAAFRRALELKPDDARVHSNLLLTLHYDPAVDARALCEEHERWNRIHAQPLAKCIAPHSDDRDPERRLCVGYVSPDFWDHVAGRYLLPLLEHQDRGRFEVICYSGVVRPDSMTERFRALAGRWRDILGMKDERVAEMIRADGVDILVDLSQHMAGNRLPVFARKPAPVQVSFLGYPGGTGMEAIEYRISDRHLEGGSAIEAYGDRERVFFIDSFWCYDPVGVEVEVNALPATENGALTFGCLNNFCKINERVLALWARVLGRVKDSRLVMLSPSGSHRQWALDVLGRAGVEARRVEFVESRARREYLELYHRLDLVLETFPYNGHTTSLDALWMGVPVVSLAGELPVSRAGLSQLSNLGLPELVTWSEEDYVGIVERWAGDLPQLARLRASLRERMKGSVLMDAPRFTRGIEQAYREMWRAWCARPPSAH